jgi:ABC-type Co2+ transport system permease subunit
MQTSGTTRRRLITVVLAPAAALVAWGILKAFGADLVLKDGRTVDASDVVLAAVVGAIAAWLVVRWIERHSRRPRSVWAFVSSTALAISGIGPSYRADGVTALLLFGLHFVTAVVLIAGFMRTLPVSRLHGTGPSATKALRKALAERGLSLRE